MAAIDLHAEKAVGVDYTYAQPMAHGQKIYRSPPQWISMKTCKSWMTNSLRGSENGQMVTTELLLWQWKEQLDRRPASHRLAAVSVAQRLSVLAVQQPADGQCEHSPKLNTVSGLLSEWLLSALNPFGSRLSSGSEITRLFRLRRCKQTEQLMKL